MSIDGHEVITTMVQSFIRKLIEEFEKMVSTSSEMIESVSNSSGTSLLASSVRGSAMLKSHDIQSVKILDKMLNLPNQQLNVTEPIFLWMTTQVYSESYRNPFTLSLLEYLINRMSYNSGLKEFMIEDCKSLERNKNPKDIRQLQVIQEKRKIYEKNEAIFSKVLENILSRRLRSAISIVKKRDEQTRELFYVLVRLICNTPLRDNRLIRNAFILETITMPRR